MMKQVLHNSAGVTWRLHKLSDKLLLKACLKQALKEADIYIDGGFIGVSGR
jgi:hypothetical protein